MIKRLKLLPALLGCLVFTFCSNPTETKNENVQDTTVAELAEAPAPAELTFINAEGTKISLSELKGKVVFINFWATWCPPCINEMPTIDKLKQHFKDRKELDFIMVDIDNEIEASTAFMKEYGYDLPVYTALGEIPSTFLGNAIPTTVILDKTGEIFVRLEGGRDYYSKEMIDTIQELLDKK